MQKALPYLKLARLVFVHVATLYLTWITIVRYAEIPQTDEMHNGFDWILFIIIWVMAGFMTIEWAEWHRNVLNYMRRRWFGWMVLPLCFLATKLLAVTEAPYHLAVAYSRPAFDQLIHEVVVENKPLPKHRQLGFYHASNFKRNSGEVKFEIAKVNEGFILSRYRRYGFTYSTHVEKWDYWTTVDPGS